MGLLDSMRGAAQHAVGADAIGPDDRQAAHAAVIHAVVSWVSHPEQGTGGVTGLIQRLRQGGLGDAVDSWIGGGINAPADAAQIERALGEETVAALAKQARLPVEATRAALTQVLPGLIDQLTPNGHVPAEDAIDLARLDVRGLLDQLIHPG